MFCTFYVSYVVVLAETGGHMELSPFFGTEKPWALLTMSSKGLNVQDLSYL